MSGALIGGAISGIGSFAGGKSSASAATRAANIQAEAARYAADLQKEAFDYTAEQLKPFVDISTMEGGLLNQYGGATQDLYNNIGTHLTPIVGELSSVRSFTNTPTTTKETLPETFDYKSWGLGADQQSALEKTPGYQFTLDQGLKSVQNSAAAKGRGVSGNALTGAAKYATGLADSTFADQFKNAMTAQDLSYDQTLRGQSQEATQAVNYYNTYLDSILQPQEKKYSQTRELIYDPLAEFRSGLSLSANAAAGVGNAATSSANSIADTTTSGAAARASGVVGSNNALVGGYTGAGNSLSNLLLYNDLFGSSGSSSGSSFQDW